MNILVLGVNYNRTPLAIREKLSFSIEEHPATLACLKVLSGVLECSLLSTCNRTEIHFYAQLEHADTRAIEKLWCELKDLDPEDMKKYFYLYQGPQAVKHIFKVASGVDSMIIGEDQVLGQFKKAYEIALEVGATGAVLNDLSRQAITGSKKIKTLITEKKNDHSISTLVLERLVEFYGETLSTKTALVIGAGQIGTMVLKKLSYALAKLYTTKRNASIEGFQICKDTKAEIVDYEEAESKYSIPISINRVGSLLGIFFNEHTVKDYSSAIKSNGNRFRAYFKSILEEGIYLAPSQFEGLFISLAHSEEDLIKTGLAIDKAFKGLD